MPDSEGAAPQEANGPGLPQSVIEAIAISNSKSIGEQPAILANLALANQIANANLAQQYALSNQQALFNVQLAIVGKCVEMITRVDADGPAAADQLRAITDLVKELLEKLQTTAATPAVPKEESHV